MKSAKCNNCKEEYHNIASSKDNGVIKCVCGSEILIKKETFTHSANRADEWDERDQTCNFCGSLHPDVLIQRIREGNVKIIPTDKNYKIYVKNVGGEKFIRAYRIDNSMSTNRSTWKWKIDNVDETKFYFEHLSLDQRKEFIELYNNKKIFLDFPHYFYVMPFFMTLYPPAIY